MTDPTSRRMAAIGVHQPDVRVFHGGLAIGDSPFGAGVGNVFAVRRPDRRVVRVLGRRQTSDGTVGDPNGEDVVVEESSELAL